MTKNMTSRKWTLSEESTEEEELFQHCREMETVCYALTKVILDADCKWKASTGICLPHSLSNRSYIMEIVNIQVLDEIIDYLSRVVRSFYKLHPRLARLRRENDLMLSKHDHLFDRLCGTRFILLQSMHGLLHTLLNCCLHREDSRKIIESCFNMVSLYNQLTALSHRRFVARFSLCSNSYPSAVGETKPLTLTKIVQILSKSRSEVSCHRLISCLVRVYRPQDQGDDCSTSTADSIEIYHTLTKHITPPPSTTPVSMEARREAFIEQKKAKMKQAKSLVEAKSVLNRKLSETGLNSDGEVPYTSLLNKECVLETSFGCEDNVNSILQSEEMYIEILLDTAANLAPELLGPNGTKRLKSGRVQASKKAAQRVTEYYQNVLWGEVGSCLEHVVLWWARYPLAARSPSTSQNLREWLFHTFNDNNTPELVLAALRVLADALGCHVTSTSWDNNFGATLTTNLKPISLNAHPDLSLYVNECTVSGANFALMLQELCTLNNQCEVTGDYILGAPLEDLPIVEQIPILHRLDHSIHTYRLWCLCETRRLANCWCMDDFFRIVHCDMRVCMEQLAGLRFADHAAAIETGKIGVHENVCAKMREKLVSEVKVNIQKLKDAAEEIMCVLSLVCATTSLAHLTMLFPAVGRWRRVQDPPVAGFSRYTHLFLDKVLLPVVKATSDVPTLNTVLRIMCESWLHHIYVAKVKFSKDAAVQLLADFNEVRVWLSSCKGLSEDARQSMLANEVLRRCEGVGRLLLHAPGDLISMQDSTTTAHGQHVRKDESGAMDQLMPAEMYVPNQQQWLTLRANSLRHHYATCCALCM